jgi:hypothetical protein
MGNHFQVVLETPPGIAVGGRDGFVTEHLYHAAHQHRLFGHVLSGHYKSQLVEGQRQRLPADRLR